MRLMAVTKTILILCLLFVQNIKSVVVLAPIFKAIKNKEKQTTRKNTQNLEIYNIVIIQANNCTHNNTQKNKQRFFNIYIHS